MNFAHFLFCIAGLERFQNIFLQAICGISRCRGGILPGKDHALLRDFSLEKTVDKRSKTGLEKKVENRFTKKTWDPCNYGKNYALLVDFVGKGNPKLGCQETIIELQTTRQEEFSQAIREIVKTTNKTIGSMYAKKITYIWVGKYWQM